MFERVDAVTRVMEVARMPRLSKVTSQCRHNVDKVLGMTRVPRVTRLTRMPRLLTMFYAQDVTYSVECRLTYPAG